MELSLQTLNKFSFLSRDVAAVIEAIAHDAQVILVGHSMGGAIAVRAAPLIPNLYGLGVIDVVEGTAMDALASMQSFLRSRPSSFSTISQAIEWWLVFLVIPAFCFSAFINHCIMTSVLFKQFICYLKI